MLRTFIIVFYFIFCNVGNTAAFSKIYLRLRSLNEDNHVLDRVDSRNSGTDDIELISKVLEIIKQEKSGINTVEINKCLSMYIGNTRNKLNCIKQLLYKGITEENKKPYFYMNVYSKRLPYKLKHKNNHGFADLTKSGHDVERSLHTFFDFSDDYLDVNDLLRSDNKIKDESVKTKAINVFKVIENGNNSLRTVTFSADYLDTDDLRTHTKMVDTEDNISKNANSDKNLYVFELIPTKNEVKNLRTLSFSQDYFDFKDSLRTNPKITDESSKELRNEESKKKSYVFKLIPTTKDLRRYRNVAKNDFLKKILRTVSDESDSNVSSDEDTSEDDEVQRKGKKLTGIKPKRFQVLDSVKEDSSEETSNESDIPFQRPIEIPKKEQKVYYTQGLNRIFKVKNGRRRLPHFLPKRYHWDEEDMKNLENFWINGPQGKYWGAHRTPY